MTNRVRSLLRTVWKNKGLTAGLVIVLTYISVGIAVFVSHLVGFQITPYNPLQEFLTRPEAPPSLAHLFGTDELGRDVFSRIVVATPNDVGIGLAVVAVAFSVGGTWGAIAGYTGGILDEVLMRITDVFFALPTIILAIVISIAVGRGLLNMMFVLMLVGWPGYARLARGETLKIVNQNFIAAARISGLSPFRILQKHIWPNIISVLLVFATLNVGFVVLVFAALSYFGLAVTPPAPDWGQMVNLYQDYMLSAPWLPLFPGLVIAVNVIGFSIVGDGLRDVLEHR